MARGVSTTQKVGMERFSARARGRQDHKHRRRRRLRPGAVAPYWNLKMMTSYAASVQNTLKFSLVPKIAQFSFAPSVRRKIGHFCQSTRFDPLWKKSCGRPCRALSCRNLNFVNLFKFFLHLAVMHVRVKFHNNTNVHIAILDYG